MTERSGYVCHACGNDLVAVEGSKLWHCSFCDAKRRTPTHPAFMAPWRWAEVRARRPRFDAHLPTPERV